MPTLQEIDSAIFETQRFKSLLIANDLNPESFEELERDEEEDEIAEKTKELGMVKEFVSQEIRRLIINEALPDANVQQNTGIMNQLLAGSYDEKTLSNVVKDIKNVLSTEMKEAVIQEFLAASLNQQPTSVTPQIPQSNSPLQVGSATPSPKLFPILEESEEDEELEQFALTEPEPTTVEAKESPENSSPNSLAKQVGRFSVIDDDEEPGQTPTKEPTQKNLGELLGEKSPFKAIRDVSGQFGRFTVVDTPKSEDQTASSPEPVVQEGWRSISAPTPVPGGRFTVEEFEEEPRPEISPSPTTPVEQEQPPKVLPSALADPFAVIWEYAKQQQQLGSEIPGNPASGNPAGFRAYQAVEKKNSVVTPPKEAEVPAETNKTEQAPAEPKKPSSPTRGG